MAPASCNPCTIAIDGLSRMSSVFGLKVRPRSATVLPCASPPIALMILRAIERLRCSLTCTTASTILNVTSTA